MKTSFVPGLLNPHIKPSAPLLGASVSPYTPPAYHDERSKCLPPSHQGESAECVLYALCGLAEARAWKLFGQQKQLDPHPAYLEAKKIDGYPNEDGTTLEAGLQAMIKVGYISDVAAGTIRSIDTIPELKRALHRYDFVAVAWNATDGFLTPGRDGWIESGGNFLGGHATLCCYFDESDGHRGEAGSLGCQDNYGINRGNNGFWRLTQPEAIRIFAGAIVFDFLAPQ